MVELKRLAITNSMLTENKYYLYMVTPNASIVYIVYIYTYILGGIMWGNRSLGEKCFFGV